MNTTKDIISVKIQKSTCTSALSIIANNGNCTAISCNDCRLCTIFSKEIYDGITLPKNTKKWAIQWLIHTYGKERTKELLTEELI